MSTPHSLPDAGLLEKLLLGQLPPAEAEALCEQLQDSEQFAALAQSLIASDTLIESLRAQTANPTPRPDARLEAIMARLSKLRPDLSGEEADRTEAAGPTVGGTPITFLSPARQPDEMGRLGDYRVLKILGQGGMGVVFLAEDVRLGRRVALKTMRPEAAQLPNAKQRFLREARGTATIEHDHIVPIFQVGEANGVPFLAMPLLRGEPLDERLKRTGGTPLPVHEIVRIGREIAEGLSAAHEQGLIHRDIKPANVWLEGERGRVKILDFGLARAAGENTQLTQSGAIVGTPAYMAPEQARGEAIDHRCDLFSLGCLLYQMSTGQKPFNGPDTMSILMSLALDQPLSPRQRNAELPAGLSDLIGSLLSKKAEDRPASARAAADALAEIERELSGVTTVSVVRRLAPATAPARTRRRLLVAIATAILLAGGLFAAVVIIRDKHGKEVARVNVPDGGSVEVKPDDKGKPPDNDKKQSAAIPADPLPKIEPGTPLSPLALVTNPAPLPGVRSWTIETRTPHGGINNGAAVAYRPDGRLLAVAGDDGVIRLRDPSTGRLIRALVGHGHVIFQLAWSPDGRTLASGSMGGTVRLWDADTGRHLRAISESPLNHGIHSLFWLRDGRAIAVNQNNRILAWDVVSGQIVRDQTLPNGSNLLTLSPDGKRLAGQVEGGKVRLWNVETAEEVKTLAGHAGGTFAVRWSPDGRHLASAGADNVVRLWQVENGKELWSWKTPLNLESSLAWSPDAKTLAVNPVVGPIGLLRVEKGTLLSSLSIPDHARSMGWSPDSKSLAIGGGSNGVWVTTRAGRQAHFPGLPIQTYLVSLAWSPDSKQLAAVTPYGAGLRVVNATTGETTASLPDARWTVAWSPSKSLATPGLDNQIWLWEPGGVKRVLRGHTAGVMAVAWSPDGKTLASGSYDKTVRLWDAATGKPRKPLNYSALNFPGSMTWSPDGRTLAVGDYNDQKSKVTFWNIETGEQQGKVLAGFNSAVWSPKAEMGVMIGGHTLQLVSTKTGNPLFKLANEFYPRAAAWSPDGKFLASASQGYGGHPGFQVWDAASGVEVRRLERVGLNDLIALAWSPDGKRIAACGSQMIQLWDAASGKSEGVIFPHPHFHGLTIRPDGHYRGDAKVEEAIVMVVQKEDGSTETLPPVEFTRKYKWKNEP